MRGKIKAKGYSNILLEATFLEAIFQHLLQSDFPHYEEFAQ